MASYQHALKIEPDHVEALNNLGVALHAQGKVPEAIACLHQAIALKPDYAEAHSNLGNAYQEEGQLELAVACYRQALSLNPAYFDAHNNLGNVLRAQGKLAESVCSYERALELKPDHPQVAVEPGPVRGCKWATSSADGPSMNGGLSARSSQSRPFGNPSGTDLTWAGGRSFCTPTTVWVIRSSSSAMRTTVKARGGRVVVACQQPLARLIATCKSVDQVDRRGRCVCPILTFMRRS